MFHVDARWDVFGQNAKPPKKLMIVSVVVSVMDGFSVPRHDEEVNLNRSWRWRDSSLCMQRLGALLHERSPIMHFEVYKTDVSRESVRAKTIEPNVV